MQLKVKRKNLLTDALYVLFVLCYLMVLLIWGMGSSFSQIRYYILMFATVVAGLSLIRRRKTIIYGKNLLLVIPLGLLFLAISLQRANEAQHVLLFRTYEYLANGGKSCMAGFVLKNTLSDNGGVTRGICKRDEQNNLTEVVETKNIVKTATGAEVDGVAVDVNSLVSMNMWGLTPDFLGVLEEGFKEFFEEEVPGNPLKAEYLIPIFIGELLEQGKMAVKVLKTNDTWYGMTYHEDVEAVKDSFKKMLANGVYKADLFSDL